MYQLVASPGDKQQLPLAYMDDFPTRNNLRIRVFWWQIFMAILFHWGYEINGIFHVTEDNALTSCDSPGLFLKQLKDT